MRGVPKMGNDYSTLFSESDCKSHSRVMTWIIRRIRWIELLMDKTRPTYLRVYLAHSMYEIHTVSTLMGNFKSVFPRRSAVHVSRTLTLLRPMSILNSRWCWLDVALRVLFDERRRVISIKRNCKESERVNLPRSDLRSTFLVSAWLTYTRRQGHAKSGDLGCIKIHSRSVHPRRGECKCGARSCSTTAPGAKTEFICISRFPR